MRKSRNLLICDLSFSELTYKQITNAISSAADQHKSIIIAPIASHPVALTVIDPQLRELYQQIDYLLPDSQIIYWFLKLFYHTSLPERIYGPTMFLHVVKEAERSKTRLILVGNDINRLINTLKKTYPTLQVRGIDLHYRPVTDKTIQAVMEKISGRKGGIIVLGLGSPMQHKIALSLKKLHMPILTVGAAFDFVSGSKRQAPLWMQKNGLEWLYRLYHEPRRLWYRYLVLGPFFLLAALAYQAWRGINQHT